MKLVAALVVTLMAALIGLPLIAIIGLLGAVPASGAPSGVVDMARAAAATGVPSDALAAYVGAAGSCPGLRWGVLAGIGEIESDHGRSNEPGVHDGANPYGAEGPMQFLPATFTAYGADSGDGDMASPYDLQDAVVAAARMLCADGGADPVGVRTAVWDYNHDTNYVDAVLGWAARYERAAASVGSASVGSASVASVSSRSVPSGGAGPGPAAGGDVAAPAAGGSSSSPDGGSALGSMAAVWALQRVGLPYEWGASGPSSFDCSGLTLRAWEAAGVELPRVAADQYGAGTHVPLADARAGDLVFFATSPADPSTIHHVGIYLADGQMIEAPHSGVPVRVVAIYPDGLLPEVTRP